MNKIKDNAYRHKYEKYKKKYLTLKRENETIYDNIDYVIVGAGSAGCVLANRLTQDSTIKVLLIEAGPDFPPNKYPKELSDPDIIGTDKYDWGYKSTPGYIKRSIEIPRGKAVGGCSAVNAGVILRAPLSDFGKWEKLGIKSWSFTEALNSYKAMETSNVSDGKWHSYAGPMPVIQDDPKTYPEICGKFMEAAMILNYDYIEDFNNGKQYGVGISPKNIVKNVRMNTGMTYLSEDVRNRKNLIIKDKTLVDKVIFDELNNNRAAGIKLANGKQINANKEVILCAGSIGSASILLRSGIGPKEHLENLHIPVVKNLPVGKKLMEHPFYTMTFAIKNNKNNTSRRQLKPAPAVLENNKNESEIGTLLWIKSNEKKKDLDIQIVMWLNHNTVSFGIGITVPDSFGNLELTDKNPHKPPKINLNLLKEKRDIKRLAYAIRLVRQITKTTPLKEFIDHEEFPGSEISSESALRKNIIENVEGFGHVSCTAAMGQVVDEGGLVYGIEKLRVVDASVLPLIVSCPTHATVLMIAERISNFIQ